MKNTTRKGVKEKATSTIANTKKVPAPASMYDKLNGFFDRHSQAFFVLAMALSVLMCLAMFDVKVSLSGDDSDYVVSAERFWRNFSFPGGHAPLYPMVLSPLAGIFGMNLLLFKSLSAIFMVLSFLLLYKSFRNVLPAVVLMPGLLLASICSYLFFYAGYTYSEPLFMLIQGLFIYFFARYFLWNDPSSQAASTPATKAFSLKADWRRFLIIAALALCMTLTRSIGYAVLGVVILFLALQRRWKDTLYMCGAFVVVFTAFQIFKSIAWPGTGEAYGFDRLFAKDSYNPTLGMESFQGIVKRFTENSQIYLSWFLYRFMGLMPDTSSEYIQIDTLRTVGVYLLYAVCLALAFRRSRALLFIGLYVGIMNLGSFVALQSSWGQDRLIVIYYPLILLFFLGGICCLFQIKWLRRCFFVYPLALIVVFLSTAYISKKNVERNLPVLQQNLMGDKLYGFTPDWENFIIGSQWAAKNLDKDAVIISRKPTISKVYTGRDFDVVPTALTVPPDTLTAFRSRLPEGYTVAVIDASVGVFPGEAVQYVVSHLRGNKFSLHGTETVSVCIYLVPDEYLPDMMLSVGANEMAYTLDFDEFINQLDNIESYRIYDPDMMLRYLEEHNIKYLLLPQLRVYPSMKSDRFINNVHQYRDYVSFKRPGHFRTIHTAGSDEPCEIVEFIR